MGDKSAYFPLGISLIHDNHDERWISRYAINILIALEVDDRA